MIVSMISIVFPNIFELVGMMEHNHPRTQLQWQLARLAVYGLHINWRQF